jgi:hypothetical protein
MLRKINQFRTMRFIFFNTGFPSVFFLQRAGVIERAQLGNEFQRRMAEIQGPLAIDNSEHVVS